MTFHRALLFAVAFCAVHFLAHACSGCSEAAMQATNSFRSQNNLPAYKYSAAFFERCMAHSREMAAKGSLYHTNLGGGVQAENVAMRSSGGSAGTEMVQQWIDSPGHRANMLGQYKCGATALFEQGGRVWGTQMFGDCSDASSTPKDSSDPSSSATSPSDPSSTAPPSASQSQNEQFSSEPSSSGPPSSGPSSSGPWPLGPSSSGPMSSDPLSFEQDTTEPTTHGRWRRRHRHHNSYYH